MSRTRTVNVIYSTPGDFTFTVPADCFLLTLVACIGGGAGGNAEQTVSFDGKSGGGGMYAEQTNVSVTPGQTINGHVGAGGAGSGPGQPQNLGADSWLGANSPLSPSCIIYAQGGSIPGSPQVNYKGSTTAFGGAGVLENFEFGSGAGGGGAGGPHGAGAAGIAPSSPQPNGTILGGQGGNGFGGQGGQVWVNPPQPALSKGVAGTEMNGGVGSGGGGGTAVNNDVTGGPGGDGGLYGGGGGTGNSVTNSNGGSGAPGVLVISYLQNIQMTQGQVF